MSTSLSLPSSYLYPVAGQESRRLEIGQGADDQDAYMSCHALERSTTLAVTAFLTVEPGFLSQPDPAFACNG